MSHRFAPPIDAECIERALLECFDDDVPPRGAKLAAMAAVGAGVATAGIASTSVASAGAHAGVAAATAGGLAGAEVGVRVAVATKGTAIVVLKWFGAGLLGGAAVLAPTEIAQRSHASRPVANVTLTPATQGEARTLHPAPSERVASPDPDEVPPIETREAPASPAVPREPMARGLARSPSEPMASTIAEPATNAPAVAPPVGPGARAASLAAEIALLDSARRALSQGDPRSALGWLDRYDRDPSVGTLRPEAILLRVEALVKMGDRASAAALADRSIATLPEKYADKVRLLLSR